LTVQSTKFVEISKNRCGHVHVWIVATMPNDRRTIISVKHVEKLGGMKIEKAQDQRRQV